MQRLLVVFKCKERNFLNTKKNQKNISTFLKLDNVWYRLCTTELVLETI